MTLHWEYLPSVMLAIGDLTIAVACLFIMARALLYRSFSSWDFAEWAIVVAGGVRTSARISAYFMGVSLV